MNTRHLPLIAALLAGGIGVAVSETATRFDPRKLPAIQGQVAEYSLTPRGDVDGLILQDGTEVHLPPHLGAQLVQAVKPGDAVTIRGLKARAIPMVQAVSIRNDASGATVTDGNAGAPPRPDGERRQLSASGTIKAQLHGPRGDLNGALLEDGTIVRLPPPEAARLASLLTPGATIVVHGMGLDGPLGRVVEARSIGADDAHLTQLNTPQPPPVRPPPAPRAGLDTTPPVGPGPAPQPGAPTQPDAPQQP